VVLKIGALLKAANSHPILEIDGSLPILPAYPKRSWEKVSLQARIVGFG
jgi:hypothetical protein